jgi:site-specific DNA-cytosine methylase
MKLLELFSGNKSISKIFKEKNKECEVTSLDIDSKLNPDICIDILNWDYKIYKPEYFDVIWASPDCRSWSVAGYGRHRKLPDLIPKTEIAKIGEKLIYKTLEIIDYFKPKYYFIENPRGLLRHFTPMKTLPYCHLVYYGNYNYPMLKPTNIWSNIFLWENEKTPKLEFKRDNNGNNKYFSINKSNRSLIPSNLVEKIYFRIFGNLDLKT